jgi:predicted AAA+ superfamily ATPase
MIERAATRALLEASESYPIVAVTGPRQSGKTTLCRSLFKDKPYVSFERPDVQLRFDDDPLGFLAAYREGAVFDEAQRCPELFSYLQGIVDEDPRMGRFILTGSSQFHLFAEITQSLAGRVVTLQLLPFSYRELVEDRIHLDERDRGLDSLMLTGLYPPIYDRNAEPSLWYAGYVRNYVERDVRALLNVTDLSVFQRFLRLCAARTGQLINLSEIGVAAGVSHNTVKSWISILEASYVVFLVRPFHTNFSKRLVKTPKLYFYDTGLLCWLMSIEDSSQLGLHPMRGSIFESFVLSELLKARFNSLKESNLYFWRDRSGHEIDLILDHGLEQTPVEIKSGATFQGRFCRQIPRWKTISGSKKQPVLIYGGEERFEHRGCSVHDWSSALGSPADLTGA